MRLNWTPTPREESTGEETESEFHVLGGGHVGATVVRRLQANGHTVTLVDESHDLSGVPGVRGDPADVETLEEAGLSDASTVVVATPSDRRNLLVAQVVDTHFDVPRILVLVNHPDRAGPLADAGHEPVCATTAVSDALMDTV